MIELTFEYLPGPREIRDGDTLVTLSVTDDSGQPVPVEVEEVDMREYDARRRARYIRLFGERAWIDYTANHGYPTSFCFSITIPAQEPGA